jgi:predicted permease
MKKLRRVFHLGLWGPSVREGVDWEIEHHLEERIEELMAQGLERDEARAQALRALGDMGKLRHELHDIDEDTARRVRMGLWLETIGQDVRYGLRAVRHNPGFALAVVLTLGLGLGASVAMFAVLDALILRPLPYRAPDELANLLVVSPKSPFGQRYVPWKQAQTLRESNTFFASTLLHTRRTVLQTGGVEATDLSTEAVSAQFEETLGVHPILGRGFLPQDGVPGAAPVVLIDYGFWRSALGSESNVLERSIVLDGVPHSIIGVMPRGFKFPEYSITSAWLPLHDDGTVIGKPWSRVEVVGRVSGAPIEQASERAAVLGRTIFTAEDPKSDRTFRLERFDTNRARGVNLRQAMWLLSGAVTLILLVAVVNVVNLLLMRATARTRELAVRLALGAARMRLMRQLATESMTLALVAGMLAVVIALLTLRAIAGIMPGSITFFAPFAIAIEQRALWFAFLSTVACGLLAVLALPLPAVGRPARRAMP